MRPSEATNLVAEFREKFLFSRMGPMIDDFAAPLPVFHGGKVHVLQTPDDVHDVMADLRDVAGTMGMADFRGEILSAHTIQGGALCLSVDWTFEGLPQCGQRVLPVTYWIGSDLCRPSIRMVEIRRSRRGRAARNRMPLRLTPHREVRDPPLLWTTL